MLTVGSLFSGIGGLDLGLERAGMQVRWQCEIDPYCRAVLAHHWPGLHIYEDIRDIDGSAERVDLICGGFPCQPVSLAGKGLAQEDPRWLWPEFARVVGDLRPRYVLVENVPGLVKRGLDLVVTGLAEMGYDAEWEIVSAAACGAPHLRERIFVVAHCGSERRQQVAGSSRRNESPDGRRSQEDHVATDDGQGDRAEEVPRDVAYAELKRLEGHRTVTGQPEVSEPWNGGTSTALADANGASGNCAGAAGEAVFRPEAVERFRRCSCGDGSYWTTEPDVGRVAHGVPNRLAQLRALGNAVVPQVAEAVGRMILEAA